MPCRLRGRTMPVLATGVLLNAAIGAAPVSGQCQPHELTQLHAADASDDENGNGLPDECDCPGDVDGDVDLADLAALLSVHGTTCE